MVNIGADHVNKLLSMSRAIAAQGAGLNAASYGAPYPGSQTNITVQPQKSSLLPAVAGLLLGATGLGAVAGGAYALLQHGGSALPAVPAATAPAKPQSFKVDIGFDVDKGGMKVGPVVEQK